MSANRSKRNTHTQSQLLIRSFDLPTVHPGEVLGLARSDSLTFTNSNRSCSLSVGEWISAFLCKSVKAALHEKWFLQLTDSSLRSLRISVISALNISRDYRYAEITEIRRDRREDFKSRQGLLFVQSL